MPTIKDVALRAGVSTGTVSNVINGADNVSLDKVRRVQEAMKALGYRPNSFARNLKTSKTMQISVIVPNIIDFSMAQLFTSISVFANGENYNTELCLTHEIAEVETDLLNKAMMTRKDGIILMTCQPGNTELFSSLIESGQKIVFIERRVADIDHNLVEFDYEPVIEAALGRLLNQGYRDIALITGPTEYSSEQVIFDTYRKVMKASGIAVNPAYIEVCNNDRESAMKSCVRLLRLEQVPQLILVSNDLIARGVKKAIELLGDPDQKPVEVAAIVADSWSHSAAPDTRDIELPFTKLAEAAIKLLIDSIKYPFFNDANTVLIDARVNYPAHATGRNSFSVQSPQPEPLRVLLLESDVAYATESLLTDFKKKTGLSVQIETKQYDEIYDCIMKNQQSPHYDVYQVDVPWLPEFADYGILENLDKYFSRDEPFFDNIVSNVLDVYAYCDDRLYALPYMYCAQLLYYRKDLFDSFENKRHFYELFKTDLKPPETWNEFNLVAKFFTRSFNPESETLYGTTFGSRMASGAVCEFLPRLWAFGGDITQNGKVTLDSRQAVKALNNYCESLHYASPGSSDNWWDEQVNEFSSGQAAMMVLFNAHATYLMDRRLSAVVGKIGYSFIPGKVSLLGGWSLGVNKYSRQKHNASEFIKWSCSSDIAIPNTILGNCSPCRDVFDNTEIASIYPWHRMVFEAFEYTRKRSFGVADSRPAIPEKDFEHILGSAVYKAVTGQLDARTALSNAAGQLRRLTVRNA